MFDLNDFIAREVTKRPESMFLPDIEDNKKELTKKIKGKKVALFGSYGWGDGQWMRDFEERMTGYGCIIKLDCLINQNEADEDQCVEFGKQIALL